MNIDSELREILDDSFDDCFKGDNLDAFYSTWIMLRQESELSSFKDFVFGNINGSTLTLYATYKGKNISELRPEERKGLDQLLLKRIYGLTSILDNYLEKSNLNSQ
jgi:hypothetical protein